MNLALGVALLWAICAGFAFGVFLRSVVVVPELALFAGAGLSFITVLLCATGAMRLRLALVAAAALFACGAGVLRMQSAILPTDSALDAQIGERVTVEGVVFDAPDIRSTQVRVPIQSSNGTIVLAVLPAHTDISYGERVHISGLLRHPQSFDAGEGREFNYPGYLASQGISYMLERAQLDSSGGFEGNIFVAWAFDVKNLFVRGLEQSLPEPQSGLAGGLLVGDKRALGKDLIEEFRSVSLIHIVVLSGYNITIVITALFHLLGNAPRSIRFSAAGFIALFFAVMTGFASASLRAAIMSFIAISGSLSGRIYRADRALALVGAGMLAWNPYLLVFDPGFQLSFLATAGLVAFSPVAEKWFANMPKNFKLQEILVSTTSAQIAVLPLLLYQSGTLSLVSLPANLFALVAVPVAMFFSACAAVAGFLVEPAAPFIGFPAYALLSYILQVAHVFSSIPFASITVPAFSAILLLPLYALLFGAAYYRSRKLAAA